jgi:hypothetical protein
MKAVVLLVGFLGSRTLNPSCMFTHPPLSHTSRQNPTSSTANSAKVCLVEVEVDLNFDKCTIVFTPALESVVQDDDEDDDPALRVRKETDNSGSTLDTYPSLTEFQPTYPGTLLELWDYLIEKVFATAHLIHLDVRDYQPRAQKAKMERQNSIITGIPGSQVTPTTSQSLTFQNSNLPTSNFPKLRPLPISKLSKVLRDMVARIREELQLSIGLCQTRLLSEYGQYDFLWKRKPSTVLKDLVMQGYTEAMFEYDDDFQDHGALSTFSTSPVLTIFGPLSKCTASCFENLIGKLTRLTHERDEADVKILCGCIQLDTKPVNRGILNTIAKWCLYIFKFVEENVQSVLQEIEGFVELTDTGFQQVLAQSDNDATKKAMLLLKNLAEQGPVLESRFEFASKLIDLLMRNNWNLSQEILKQNTSIPKGWAALATLQRQVRDVIMPKQQNQLVELQMHMERLVVLEDDYSDQFAMRAPFRKCGALDETYRILDSLQQEIEKQKADYKVAKDNLQLFSVLHEHKFSKRGRMCIDLDRDVVFGGSTDLSSSQKSQTPSLDVVAATDVASASAYDIEKGDGTGGGNDRGFGPPRLGRSLDRCSKELVYLKQAVDFTALVDSHVRRWEQLLWSQATPLMKGITQDALSMQAVYSHFPSKHHKWEILQDTKKRLRMLLKSLPIIEDLLSPCMKYRHWQMIMVLQKTRLNTNDPNFKFAEVLNLDFENSARQLRSIVEQARKESLIEKELEQLELFWTRAELKFEEIRTSPMATARPKFLATWSHLESQLEDNQMMVHQLLNGRHLGAFEERVRGWQTNLFGIEECFALWKDVQRVWKVLFPLFCREGRTTGVDFPTLLPEENKKFTSADGQFQSLCSRAAVVNNILKTCSTELQDDLKRIWRQLEGIRKALQNYLEMKRSAFPRLYFLSSDDLFSVLATPDDVGALHPFFPKLFDNVARLRYASDDGSIAEGVSSCEGEALNFPQGLLISPQEPPERWLESILYASRAALHHEIVACISGFREEDLHWLLQKNSQVVVLATQVMFGRKISHALVSHSKGHDDAMTQVFDQVKVALQRVAEYLRNDLSRLSLRKATLLATSIVHARDVLARLLQDEDKSPSNFTWKCQMKMKFDNIKQRLSGECLHSSMEYSNEFFGNRPRLVLTPLTERCFVTMTLALSLNLGGALSGPAGERTIRTKYSVSKGISVQISSQ